MTVNHAFFFDAGACSGCKACQAACKDKNNLPPGVLWRRVVEVSGGTWQQAGEAWNNTVFAYNVSIACNHCVHPKCAGICPANAYIVRADGIVLLDTTKCAGCGYCSWSCPYGAPQYNPVAGYMTKCDLCIDQLEQGLPPSCVAACPLRVLDYRATDSPVTGEMRLWDLPADVHPFPLPVYSHTQPRLAIKPHAAMHHKEEKRVANREEIQPRVSSIWEEIPLIIFTLFAQTAVGGFWAMLWTFPSVWISLENQLTLLGLLPSLVIGACLGAAMLASLAHLGTKRRAVHMLRNVRRSWLSREILFLGLFGLGWLFIVLEQVTRQLATPEWMAVTATFGFGLIHSMAQVYRLRTVPVWNTWRTNVSFMVSALLLGHSLMAALLAYEFTASARLSIGGIISSLLVIQIFLMQKSVGHDRFYAVRIGVILVGITLTVIGFLVADAVNFWVTVLLLLTVMLEEGLGRWSFYQARPLNGPV